MNGGMHLSVCEGEQRSRFRAIAKVAAETKAVVLFGVIWILLLGTGRAAEVKRVISLAPSITENIYLVGAQEKLVGCTSYCQQALNDGVPKVGSTIEINIEKVLVLKPDLVLAMKLTKPQDVEALRKLGVRVEVMETPRNFDEICWQTLHIAELLGKSKQARQVIDSARREVQTIIRLASSLPRRKVFFQIGANPVFTVLEGTYMNDFITFCNGINIARGMTRGTITREKVLAMNPDVMIIAEMGGFGESELEVWKEYSGITAIQRQRIFLIPSETSCSPTPVNFVKALRDVFRFMGGSLD